MNKVNKPMYYWNFERVKEEALKYKYKKDFKKYSNGAYCAAKSNKWYDIVCSHMLILGNRVKRCIYVWEFEDNSAYIGLTYNFEERKYNHSVDKRSSVYKQLSSCLGICYKLTEYIDKKEAQKLETFYIEKYKNNGWSVLNKVKAGALGGSELKYTFETCAKEALKYKHRSEFKYKNKNIYQATIRNKWIDNICSHMTRPTPYNYKWCFENVKNEALKYNNRMDFSKYSSGAYDAALSNKWLDVVCFHMNKIRNKKGYWDYIQIKKESLKYNTRTVFHLKCSSAYNIAYKNNWLDDLFPIDISNILSKEYCNSIAKKYKFKQDFRKNDKYIFNLAYRNDWLDNICFHMIKVVNKKNFWNLENCKEKSIKCNGRKEFHLKYSAAYDSARRNNWLDVLFPIIK
jgi:predicted GIY-YIG superfamily endonuclease